MPVCQGSSSEPIIRIFIATSLYQSLFRDSRRCLSHSWNLGCLRYTQGLSFPALTVSGRCPCCKSNVLLKYHWVTHDPSHNRCLHFIELSFLLVPPMELIPWSFAEVAPCGEPYTYSTTILLGASPHFPEKLHGRWKVILNLESYIDFSGGLEFVTEAA